MAKYRNHLPQLSSDKLFIISGGLETALIYKGGIDLPCFASCYALKEDTNREWMKNHIAKFVKVGQKYNVGVILETPTWRANPDWINKIDFSGEDVISINSKAVDLINDIRNEYQTEKVPIVINGVVGPRGDGYNPTVVMSADEAQVYHTAQIDALSKTNADMITAVTLNYPEEAIGIARAAKEVHMPVAISFTLETDGKLPTGQTLKEAIELVDNATQNLPVYYMINCAHTSHFDHVLNPEEPWVRRIHGIKGNASKKSHAELNESTVLDDGNPVDFGQCNQILSHKLKNLNILGGCCGTDTRHVEETCKACTKA
ncbi:unnamed protein product [Adineta steineri]|uniref:Hcy-binding domain-containing protein n=1 Tax=Adineta steineri TaxID=433720 RepID=A0A818XJP4_9BILA|nr:unnamed protein product [Adineta steineri]CAF3741525.1 unnamed protein product [Adineta steineri]